MYRGDSGTPDERYSLSTVEEILDNCFIEFVFCGLACFPIGCIIFLIYFLFIF